MVIWVYDYRDCLSFRYTSLRRDIYRFSKATNEELHVEVLEICIYLLRALWEFILFTTRSIFAYADRITDFQQWFAHEVRTHLILS